MIEASIILPLSVFMQLDEFVRQDILSRCAGQAATPAPSTSQMPGGGNDAGQARLSVSDAKFFLNNCNAKTRSILQEIVKRNGDFMSSEIAIALDSEENGLRGAWAGITKRTRTVTGDRNAKLIKWFRKGNDWHGEMATQTVTAMRTALIDRI